jgi:branched-chain amino acid transport system substrate-binding protein
MLFKKGVKKKEVFAMKGKKKNGSEISRRDFIKRSGGVAAGVLGASLLDPFGTPFVFAKSKEPIKLGFCEVLSGLFGSIGDAEVPAAKLAEKHINANGGILGRPLKLVIQDTQCKAQDAARIAKRIILDEGIIALHGETCTSVTKVLSGVAKEHGIIHWDYEVDGTSCYEAMHKLAFRLGNDGPTQMRGIVEVAVQRYPQFKKWAVLTPDYAWGHDCLNDFKEAIENSPLKGAEVLELVHPFGCADFSTYIQQALDFKPDGFVTISWAGDMLTFLRQQKPYELYKKTVGFHYASAVSICKAMGDEMEPMWAGMEEGHPSLPGGKKFNEIWVKETGEWVYEDTTASYYDSVMIMKKAIEAAQSTKPTDIAKQMEGLEYDGYAGYVKIRPTSHLPIRSAYYVGYMGPVSGAPYWLATDIVKIPYEKVMVTDQEAKEKWNLPIPFEPL